MTIIEALILLRNDLRSWVAYNLQHKIDKEEGKGLSTNDYTDADKNKLDGIAANAEVNVQSDWAIQDESSDAFIKNKPTIPTVPDYLPNQYSLKFGDKSYNGSSEQTITAADLGLSQALKYHGVSETALADGSTTNPITILGESHTAESGCVVFYNNKEFVWNGTVWEELGDLSGVDFTGYATEQWVEDKKYLTLETDPVFDASPAKGITDDDIKNWNSKTSNVGTITGIKMNGVSKGTSGVVDLGTVITNVDGKVDKVDGKGLSENDFTDTLKTKLEGLSNYDDTSIQESINKKQDKITDLDTIRTGAALGATALQAVPAEYVTETELAGKGYATTAQVDAKQDVITDLDNIRSGAAAGAAAKAYADSLSVNYEAAGTAASAIAALDLSNTYEAKGAAAAAQAAAAEDATSKANAAQIAAIADAAEKYQLKGNYATVEQVNAKQDVIEDLDVIRSGATLGATALQAVPEEYVTETELKNKGYLTAKDISQVEIVDNLTTEDSTKALSANLGVVINKSITTVDTNLNKKIDETVGNILAILGTI